ncbi:MAG: polyisoprenoid-binding protein YceI [Candidatus Azotimanducaceae bacterium]|jgi:polyisoprenoid-binding protein YceI
MSNRIARGFTTLLISAVTLIMAPIAAADWKLDPEASYLGFGSVKNDLIAENHHFKRLQGTVSSAGLATITVDLTSVETMIPIRNERMQQMLFKTDQFGIAVVTSQLDIASMSSLATGAQVQQAIDVAIKLHGIELSRSIPVKVVRSSENSYDVTSLGPIFIHASQFALSDGVESLRKIAGLQSIELMIPLTVDLRFTAVTVE